MVVVMEDVVVERLVVDEVVCVTEVVVPVNVVVDVIVIVVDVGGMYTASKSRSTTKSKRVCRGHLL